MLQRKSAVLTPAEIMVLACLFVLHWGIVIALCSYMLWGKRKGDVAYLIFFSMMVLSWSFFHGCPISDYERHILYVNPAELPAYVNPSLQLYQNTSIVSFIFMTIVNIVHIGTIAFVMQRIGIPHVVTILICMILGFIMAEARIHEFKSLN